MKTTLQSGRKALRKIAVPTDFFPGSTSAMAYAAALAKTAKGKVIAVHAVDPFEYSFGPKDLRSLKQQEVWARAREAMAQWLQANKFSCTTDVIEGEAGPAIAGFLDQQGIDLTVLGTSARRHAARLLLGSVAEEIFRKANCLVLVLGPKIRPRRRPDLKHLVFATGLEPHSLNTLSRLSILARNFGSTISVIRAVHPDIRSRSERNRLQRETELKIKAAADSGLRKRIKKIGVVFGHPVKAITNFANASKADAIVMGIRSGGEWDRAATHIPWAFAHRVIAVAPCPVLTIRG